MNDILPPIELLETIQSNSKQSRRIIMPWYPKAKNKQLSINFSKRVTKKNAVILHSSASATATSLFGWFSNPSAQASSHFHVDFDGNVEQYLGTDHVSWANRDGNPRSVTIETQGKGTEPWTERQIKALVDLVDWICATHDIPVRIMENSQTSTSGIGWHRIGIDGNFPTSGLLRGRNARGGGEAWSGFGKTCPGDDRILQVPRIINMIEAKRKAESGSVSEEKTTVSKPSTTSTTYKVKKGDTLWAIARKFGTTVKNLLALNKVNPDDLQVGSTLNVSKSSTPTTYKVKKGDTLWSISQKYGVSTKDLMSWNGLVRSIVYVDQVISIVPNKPEFYTVVKGDTLWGISSRFGLTLGQITELNKGISLDDIAVGQKIKLR